MFHRRELLQVGCSSFLGVNLACVLNRDAVAAEASRAKSIVMVFLTGGGSHIDMFDPKPDSAEVKGEFSPISTAVSGIQFSDQLPQLAQRASKFAVVRSMSHGDNRHLSGTHNALTGAVQPFRGTSNQDKSLNRADWPSYGAATSYLRPRPDGLPSQVTLPNPLQEGSLIWPAQHAGFLGAKHDPFVLDGDPSSEKYQVQGLSLIGGQSMERLQQKRRLLATFNADRRALNQARQSDKYSDEQDRAYAMLTSPRLRQALDIAAERPAVRERYGRHKYGQTLLLARKLVELEMPVIQCNMGHVQMWDTHVDHFPRLKTMLPALDTGLSALIDDLDERGLLQQTLVVCVGEFGRTPSISPLAGQKVPGRHHWAHAYSALFAGAGVLGGQVIGETDKIGGHPVTTPYHPNDMGATIYTALGIDPHQMLPDRFGRPRHLCQGKVMDVLYGGGLT